MNRRSFIQIASAAIPGIPFVRKAFAQPTPKIGTAWGGLHAADLRRRFRGSKSKLVGSFEAARPTVKVTGVWWMSQWQDKDLARMTSQTHESVPFDCAVNESGYVEVPQIIGPLPYPEYTETVDSYLSLHRPPDAYRVYAPQHGFQTTGPWYFLKEVRYRDAKQARFTIAVDYQDSDLICQLMPGEYERIKENRL